MIWAPPAKYQTLSALPVIPDTCDSRISSQSVFIEVHYVESDDRLSLAYDCPNQGGVAGAIDQAPLDGIEAGGLRDNRAIDIRAALRWPVQFFFPGAKGSVLYVLRRIRGERREAQIESDATLLSRRFA